MKNRITELNLRIVATLLFFNSMSGVCLALEVAKESAQIEFDGDDEGVYAIITDPQGRRVGYDIATKQYIEEFPASFGFSFKDIDGVSGRDEISDKFNGGGMLNLIPGTYTIEVIGVGLTVFEVGIGISRRIKGEGFTDINFEGIIDKGLVSTFQFTYTSDPSKPAGTATRLAAPSSLKQDITLSRKIGWIENEGIMNSLLKKIEAIEASIAKGKNDTAKNQLNALVNEINAQKGKQIDEKAVKVFLEDVQYIIDQLK